MRRRNSPVPNNGLRRSSFREETLGGTAERSRKKKKGKLREAQFTLQNWKLGFLFWLLRADGSRWLSGLSKAQEPSCAGAEDQVEAQRLPKMAARNTGGHQRIRQQQDGCPASQKERRGQSRLPPGSVEHPNEWVQTPHVEQRSEHGKGVDPRRTWPVVLPCRPEGCLFRPPVKAPQFRVSPSDVVAEEHVQEDECGGEDGDSQEERSRLWRDSRRHRWTNGGSAPLAERQDSQRREQGRSNRALHENGPNHSLRQFI